jgi:hypothetical protein
MRDFFLFQKKNENHCSQEQQLTLQQFRYRRMVPGFAIEDRRSKIDGPFDRFLTGTYSLLLGDLGWD